MKTSLRLLFSLCCVLLATIMSQAQTRSNTFLPGPGVNYNGTAMSTPLLADFDGDGDLDMISYLSGNPYSLILFINDGTGHFDGGTAIPGTEDATYNIGDVDNDGDTDIVCAQLFSNHTYGKIFLNDGHGSFTMMDGSFISGFVNSYPLITVVDIDRDGRNDIIYSGIRNDESLYQSEIWLNTGTMGNPDFALSQITTPVDVPYGGSVTIADIDEDGDLDMGSASNGNGFVLFINDNGIFTVTTPVNDYCSQSYFADWDHDGHLDLVYFDGYNNSGMKWRKGDGHGNFAETAIVVFNYETTGIDFSHWSAFVLKDVNNDDFPDVIFSFNDGDFKGTKLFLNKGCSYGLQPYDLASGATTTQGTIVGDLNGDGLPDVITAFDRAEAQVYFNDLETGTILPLPVVTVSGAFTACGSSTPVTLRSTATANATLQWWDSPSGGSLLATGDEYAVQISETTVFYVDAVNSNGCASSERLAVTVNFVEITSAPATIEVAGATEFCPSGSVTLIANGSGSNFLWSNNETTSSITVTTSGEYSATITDEYGCSAKTDVVVITVSDLEPPVFIDCPGDITVNASSAEGALVNYTLPSATDNCSVTVTLTSGFASDAMFPIGTTTVTYTATDAGGQTATCSFTVTVTGIAPVIHCPSNITVDNTAGQCGANVNFAATETTGASTITYSHAPGSFFPVGSTTVTATATNAVGSSSCSFIVTVNDVTAPIISCGNNISATATSASGAIITYTAPVGTDNCSGATTIRTSGPASGATFPIGVTTVTYTVTDAAGNTANCSFTVTVAGLPPVIHCPMNITAEASAGQCGATVSFAATETTGSPASTISYTENGNPVTPGSFFTVGTHTIIAVAVNAVGTATCNFTITVVDHQFPVLTGVPSDITVACNAVPAAATVTATDNCSASAPSFTETRTDGNCAGRYTLTRVWSTTDASGNKTTATQVIAVEDTQAPVLSEAPADITVECNAVPAAEVLTATDNCSTPVVTYVELRADGNCSGRYTLTRTWTATDGCGNTSSKTQVITVLDTQAPVLSDAPANISVECNAVPIAAILTATDNCSTPVVVYTEVRTDGNCPNNYILTRTWTATDACGNTSGKTQVITVQDTQKPILSVAPADVTVECNAVPAAATLTATDNCSTPVVTYNEIRTNGTSAGNYTLTRTWTATDACGNHCSKTQVITVRDTQAPIATVAALPILTGDCSVIAVAPTASDNCAGMITATTLNPTSYTAQGVYTITWNYNDGNGNTSSQTQRVVVMGVTPPVPTVNVLPTVTGQCSVTVTVKPTATDACSGTTFVGTTTDPLTYTIQGSYIVHWTYTGNSGNKSYQNQIVIVQDNIAPVPNTAGLPVIEGQCSVNIKLVNSTRCTDNCYCCRNVCHCRSNECNCRSWSEWIYSILSYFLGGAFDNNHGCDHDDDVDDVNNMKMLAPTATDNCKGTIIGTTTDPLRYSTQGTYTIHWKFDDGNGNTSTQNQTVIIKDESKPNLSEPKDITISCGTSTLPAATGKATATDNCSTPVVSYSDVTAGNKITRTWQAKDAAGNTTTSTQVITLVDNAKPTISDVSDITVNCGASTLPAATGSPIATDACSTPVVNYTDVVSGNKITRTWKATDAAGNYSTSTQTITIGAAFTATISSDPTGNTYTGGNDNNLYIGYGAQSTALTVCSLPLPGAPYTYAWSGNYTNKLNSTSSAAPVFTPATFGYYTFSVTVTNRYGCTSSATISICVTDVRVAGSNGKVYVCHAPPGNPANRQTLSVNVNAVDAHLRGHAGDRLGSCDAAPCTTPVSLSTTPVITTITKEAQTEVAATNEELKVTVLPNPTTTFFTLKLESKYETPVNIRVMDESGRVIDARSKIGANSTIQIGHNYSSGTYYAELVQGTKRKVVQMIKGRINY